MITTVEGSRARRGPAPSTGGLRRPRRHPVRFLHAWAPHVGQGTARQDAAPHRARDPQRHRRQPLPLHGLRQGGRGDPGGRRRASVRTSPHCGLGVNTRRLDGRGESHRQGAVRGRRHRVPTSCGAPSCAAHAPTHASSGIDTEPALALPGVAAAVTGGEVPDGHYGVDLYDQQVLARDKVRWIGEPVALVAAETSELAADGGRPRAGRRTRTFPRSTTSTTPWRPGRPGARAAPGVRGRLAGHPSRQRVFGEPDPLRRRGRGRRSGRPGLHPHLRDPDHPPELHRAARVARPKPTRPAR